MPARIARCALAFALGLGAATRVHSAWAVEPVGSESNDAPVGPRSGSGQRSVDQASTISAPAEAGRPAQPEGTAKADGPAVGAHRRGRPPKEPLPTLPPGAARGEPDQQARRAVTGGATRDELAAGKKDAQLQALREAEQVLFPHPLPGAVAGWSWDLLGPPPSDGPELFTTGVPPSGDLALRAPGEQAQDAAWLAKLQMPNLPVRFDERVVKYLRLYRDSRSGQAIARAWAKKSGRYVRTLQGMLAAARLPTDLVWLSLIESGHNPTIRSPAGAAGLWQFIPGTAHMYGLTVDRWVDERLDPRRSTEAAILCLSDLHQRFGNWHLAMAAYNMGHGGLARAVLKYNTNDFWELSRYEAGLPWETTLYVPKILAIAIVMNNKKAFGIDDVEPDPPETFDTVLAGPSVPLASLASKARLDKAELVRLNPQYLASRTPPAGRGKPNVRWPVNIPAGKASAAKRAVKAVAGTAAGFGTYVARFGDTTEAVVKAHGVHGEAIRRLNDLLPNERLPQGTLLLAPRGAAAAGGQVDDNVAVVPASSFSYPKRRRVFYRVVPGDTPRRVAAALGVSALDLAEWNALDRSARLQSNMVLQAFVRPGAYLKKVRYFTEKEARVLVVGSAEFFEHFEGQNGRQRQFVIAKEGDTLRSIGQRYGMSVGSMERVNRRSRRDDLQPGEQLVVYARRGAGGALSSSSDTSVTPLGPVDPPRPEALPPYRPSSSRAGEVKRKASGS